jgi:hypothetical protein
VLNLANGLKLGHQDITEATEEDTDNDRTNPLDLNEIQFK